MTTELWLAVGVSAISLAVAYGLITTDEASAWQALAAAVIPLALAIVSQSYSKSRAAVKTEQIKSETVKELEMMKLESVQRAEGIIE
ncbi:MAG: hypothetical protein M9918_14350 [Anaerolineae bacterium]|nr:hypothetical protein [Anaerolineae bacterium]MCO5195479.1 hypothetical protein [Anaerolineae bacterium]